MATLLLYEGKLTSSSTPDTFSTPAYLSYYADSSAVIRSSGSELGSIDSVSTTIVYARLDTTSANSARAGYSNYKPLTTALVNTQFPTLNGSEGFSLSFTLRIKLEGHANLDRAGFSVTLLDRNGRGVELGFWTNEIWAQQLGFVHGTGTEASKIDTTQWRSYDLLVLNGNYYLSSGSQLFIYGGARAYGSSPPYNLSNFLFLGDNTTNANAQWDLARLALRRADLPATNAVTAGSADDLINAGDGDDIVNGAGGKDVLIGGLGGDRLNGGSGHDRLFGQAGADRYVFDSGAGFSTTAFGIDTVMDFSRNDGDKLVLDKSSFTALLSASSTGTSSGFSISAEFAIVTDSSAAATSNALIVYDTTSGALFYNQNSGATGLGTGGQFASLLGRPVLQGSDFLLQA